MTPAITFDLASSVPRTGTWLITYQRNGRDHCQDTIGVYFCPTRQAVAERAMRVSARFGFSGAIIAAY
jgi:hypothetical protein